MSHVIFCQECGTRFDEGASNCRNCGAPHPRTAETEIVEAPQTADATALKALTAELAEALAPKLQLLRPLGQGGMGTVFLARDPDLKRLVVVKVLSPEFAHHEQARRRFEREAESAAAVAHPNVVGVYQVGRLPHSGTSYFVMQYVDGQTLADAFPLGTVVPVPRARRIVCEVAAALAAAHARGLVHRDIKPANVMVERDSDRVIVLDFGISAAIGPERRATDGTKLTQVGTSIGTPQYMSPEQAAAEELTDRSDVYSLGVVAYELLAGRELFEEKAPMALAAAHINKTPAPIATIRSDLDAPFAQLVDRCLAKSPSARPSAEEVVRSLGAAAGPVIEWPPPGLDALHGLGTRLSRALMVVVAAALVFFALLFHPPTFGSAQWISGELSDLWFAVGGGCCESRQVSGPIPRWDPTPAWQFLLALLVIAEAALAAFALVQAYRVYALVLRARRSGYPVRICLDVAFDSHRDTAALVNGGGAFASLDAALRARVRRWRRERAAIVALAAPVTVVLMFAWLMFAGSGSAHSERVISASAFALLLVPLGGALVASALLAAREGSVVPHARLTWRQWLVRQRQPLVIRDVAMNWLRGTDETAPARIARDRWLLASGHGVLGLLLLCMVLMMALVAYVAFSASMTVALHRGTVSQWQDGQRPWKSVTWHQVDSAVRALGVLPAAMPPDSEATATVVRLMMGVYRPSDEESLLWSAAKGALPVAMPGYREMASKNGGEWNVGFRFRSVMTFRARESNLFATFFTSQRVMRQAIERNVASSAFQAWRRFARATPPPPVWYFAPEFGGLESASVLGHSDRLYRVAEVIRATALGEILLAAERGDRASALAAAGELLEAGLTLGREPVPEVAYDGRLVVSDGILALRFLAQRAGDQGLEARVSAVGELMSRQKGRLDSWTPILILSDPGSASAGVALAGMNPAYTATPLEPDDRWTMIAAIAPAFCLSPREVLLGLDRRRSVALESALGKQADLPRTDEWIRATLRRLKQLRDDPGSAAESADGVPAKRAATPWPLRPLGWVGLGAMRERITFCRQQAWYSRWGAPG